ncbi:MAG: hypothetical protein ACRBK7_13980 [Acidimicrobiales bacterium]
MSTDKTVRPPQWSGGDAPLARPAGRTENCAPDRDVVERAVIERAAEALRSLLDATDGEVLADLKRCQLLASSGSMTISLGRLFDQLAEAPAPQWPERIERFVAAAVASQQTIRKLRVHDWDAVADRLMIRVVPIHSAGPLGRAIGHDLTLDVGIDVDEAIIIPTPAHVASWNQPAETLISTARRNSRRKLRPRITSTRLGVGAGLEVEVGIGAGDAALNLSLLCGDSWATGIIVDLDHFIQPPFAARAAEHPEYRRFVSCLDRTTLAVFESAPASWAPTRSDPAMLRSAVERIVSGWFDRPPTPLPSPSTNRRCYNLFEVRSSDKTEERIRPIHQAAVPGGD